MYALGTINFFCRKCQLGEILLWPPKHRSDQIVASCFTKTNMYIQMQEISTKIWSFVYSNFAPPFILGVCILYGRLLYIYVGAKCTNRWVLHYNIQLIC